MSNISKLLLNGTEYDLLDKQTHDEVEALKGSTYTKEEVDQKVGAVVVPTKTSDLTNDSKFQTESDVNTAISNLIGGAPEALDTLKEIADKLGDNDNAVAGIVNTLATKAEKSEIPDVSNFVERTEIVTTQKDGIMSKGDKGALEELISRTVTVTLGGTGISFAGDSRTITVSISKLSSLAVSKLELLSGATNNPTTVANTFTDGAVSKSQVVTPTTTTYYRWRATINGGTYQSTAGAVTIVAPIYMGFGDTASAVKVDANKHNTPVTQAKNITLERTNSTGKITNLYLLVPTGVTQPATIKSGGAPVSFEKDTTSVSGYTVYKLGGTYDNGFTASVELA